MARSKKQVISDYMAKMGSKGGKTKGESKARTSEQARKAVNVRWEKSRKAADTKPDEQGAGD